MHGRDTAEEVAEVAAGPESGRSSGKPDTFRFSQVRKMPVERREAAVPFVFCET
jgi:hypothetical protein